MSEETEFSKRHASVELKHTPGPWQSCHEWGWDGLCSIIGNIDGDPASPTYTSVCDIDDGCDEFLANRNLIVAAPDLLAALKGMVEQAGYAYMTDDELEGERAKGNGFMPYVIAARAALAKASPELLRDGGA